MCGKDEYSHLFSMNLDKYSHALGNLWELASHISELRGLFNSINFSPKLIVWKQSSFSYDILEVCCGDCLDFLISSNFLKHLQTRNDMAFDRIFPCYGNLYIPKHWGLHGFPLTQNL